MVSVKEVLTPVSRPEAVDGQKNYHILGAHWYAKGLYTKDIRSGSQIQAKKLYRVEQGDFVYNRLFAWKGSFAVASEENRDCYVSNEFPCFVVNQDHLDSRYLWRYFSRAVIWEEALGLSTGGTPTSRNRLKEDKLLAMKMPLPLLEEQRWIVAKIEELAAKIKEAYALRQRATQETEAALPSLLHELFEVRPGDWRQMSMDQAVEISDKQVDPALPEYASLPHISGENMESKTCRLLPWRSAKEDGIKSNNYLFSPGTVLYSKIRPYLRKAVFVDFQGVCSADVYPIRVISPQLDPHFLKWSLVAETFTKYANHLSGRTRMPKLNRKQLFGFPFIYPPLSEQRRIVGKLDALEAKVDALRRIQAETNTELETLLPSILDKAFKGEL
jgi:type I restriction enzyme S subunit